MNRKIVTLSLVLFSLKAIAAPISAPSASQVAAVRSASVRAQEVGAAENRPTRTAPRAPVSPPAIVKRTSKFYAGFGINMPNVRGYTGLMPKLFAGYGYVFGQCPQGYLGLEVFGGAGSIPLSSNQDYRVQNFYGGSILPGFIIYDTTILYARLGGQRAYYSNLDRHHGGTMVGIGIQPLVDEHWDLRLDYSFTFNDSLNQYSIDFIYKFC